jgi:hypothetical protein
MSERAGSEAGARLGLPALGAEGLTAVAEATDDGVEVHFGGSAELTAQAQLQAFLKTMHEEVLRRHGRRVAMDFGNLEFMNSSCFKTFLSWIGDVQQVSAEQRYQVTFVANESRHWQKRSLDALRCFAADLITIQPSR